MPNGLAAGTPRAPEPSPQPSPSGRGKIKMALSLGERVGVRGDLPEDGMHLLNQLVRKGLLRDADLPAVAQAQAAAPNRPVHLVLIDQGFIKEEALLPALAEEFDMELVDLTKLTVEPDMLKAMPRKLVERRSTMPLCRL